MSLSPDTPKSKSKSIKYTRVDTESNQDNDTGNKSTSNRFLTISKSFSPRPSRTPSYSNRKNKQKSPSPSPQAHARKSIAIIPKSKTRRPSIHNLHDDRSSSIANSKLLPANNNTQNQSIIKMTRHESTSDDNNNHNHSKTPSQSEDDIEEEEDSKVELTPLPTNRRSKPNGNRNTVHRGSIYNFQANEQILKQELVQDMLERLKIALTFLLHDLSPLWNDDENEDGDGKDEEYENDISSIYAKGTLSSGNLVHNNKKDKKMKKQWSGHSNFSQYSSNNPNKTTRANFNFQKRCTEYTENDQIFGSFKKNKQRLDSLFEHKYVGQWRNMYKLWCKWLDYAQMLQSNGMINIGDLHDEIEKNQQILEV